jgi:hypothetical protein
MSKKQNSKNNNNNNNNGKKYQISGMMENYTYDANQGVPFDPTSISISGHSKPSGLSDAVINQQVFSNNYNNYKNQSTFNQTGNASEFNNLSDQSQYDIKDAFKQDTPILKMPDNKYMNNTLYNNMNENLLKESVRENILHINSKDRNIELYPDPFNYVVTLGPIVNSAVNYGDKAKTKNLPEVIKQINDDFFIANEQIDNSEFIFDSPDLVKKYTTTIINSVNPYISKSFERVKFFRIDVSVLPRFNVVAINSEWNYCNNFIKRKYIKDDYERFREQHYPKYRYIPDDSNISPLGGRFVQVVIKEITNDNSFGTNDVSDKSYLLIVDKIVGALYIKYNPYSAIKTYRDPYPGNISRLSIQFYDSEGNEIKLEMDSINYEINQIKKTKLIDPSLYDINKEINKMCIINNPKICDWLILTFNEIIKSFVMINFDIFKLIPFYVNAEIIDESVSLKNDEEKDCDERFCIKNYSEIILNQETFCVDNIFDELSEFVTQKGFVSVYKLTTDNKKVKISIDNYINNIIWYNNNCEYIDIIKYNINAIDENYKNFGFNLLNGLKTEIIDIPLNPWFQNYLVFVLGIFVNDLSTKINYGNG